MARPGHTRKKRHGKQSKQIMSIPELRKSLEYIQMFADQHVKSGKQSVSELAKIFAEEWKKVFGKSLDQRTAESYIKHIRSVGGKKKATTRRKMRGGASPIAGAPLDYLTRPGLDLPYGNFLKYVDSGFWYPEPSERFDPPQQAELPPAGMGSNRMSGGNWAAALFRPFVATNPPSVQQDAMTAWKGQPLGPGPEVYQQAWNYQTNGQPVKIPVIGDMTRDLSADIQSK